MTTEALKPCPFCGSDNLFIGVGYSIGTNDFMAVECIGCEATTVCQPTKEEAVTRWNRRALASLPEGAPNPGFVLLPLEPTQAMNFAADTYATETANRPKGFWWWGAVYKAMVAASLLEQAGDPK